MKTKTTTIAVCVSALALALTAAGAAEAQADIKVVEPSSLAREKCSGGLDFNCDFCSESGTSTTGSPHERCENPDPDCGRPGRNAGYYWITCGVWYNGACLAGPGATLLLYTVVNGGDVTPYDARVAFA